MHSKKRKEISKKNCKTIAFIKNILYFCNSFKQNKSKIFNIMQSLKKNQDENNPKDLNLPKETSEFSGKVNVSLEQENYKNFLKEGIFEKSHSIGSYTFDAKFRTLQWKKEEIQSVTHKEKEILCLLLENVNSLVTREYILNSFWGEASYYSSRSLDLFIHHLRKKLEKDPHIEILTIRGDGFILKIKKINGVNLLLKRYWSGNCSIRGFVSRFFFLPSRLKSLERK
ncbi:MAG: winged helix-turn-helix domain-containing protein [Dysgonamonadaceae bacterium]|jgi:DNA-binding winged helix-turn-helix (wHTH) protein|nr:winged helix-turn-helix domain-containing protein [Dysgonamonadaceae bacterium]